VFLYFKLLVLYLQGFKNLAGRQFLSTTIGKMVCFLALMVANILLFWGSEQKILSPAGKWMAEKALTIRSKKQKGLSKS